MTSKHVDHFGASLDKMPGNKARRGCARQRVLNLVGFFLLAAFREARL